MWPFNRVWPLNGGPFDGGSTVLYMCMARGCSIIVVK